MLGQLNKHMGQQIRSGVEGGNGQGELANGGIVRTALGQFGKPEDGVIWRVAFSHLPLPLFDDGLHDRASLVQLPPDVLQPG